MPSKYSLRLKKHLLISIFVIIIAFVIAQGVQATFLNNKISGDIVSGGDVLSYTLSPDGKYTVFIGDLRINGINEIFSVPIMGGERIQLNTPLTGEFDVAEVLISPNSQTAVYLVNGPDRSQGLYAVPLEGGSVITLIDGLPEDIWIENLSFSYNSEHIIFLEVDPPTEPFNRQVSLFTVPLTGGDPIQISSTCFDITYVPIPNALGVIYLTHPLSGPYYLMYTDLFGSSEIYDFEGSFGDIKITPDGDHIIYIKGLDPFIYGVFSLPIEGGTPIMLNGTLIEGGSVTDFKISPNSQFVVYRADELVDDKYELFSVKANGTASREPLIQGMIADGDVESYKIMPNSQGVVYRADQLFNERFDLGSVAITGGTNYWLNQTMIPSGDVSSFDITPNSVGVVFIADKEVDEKDELYAVSVIGTSLTKLNTELPADRSVVDFQISHNSQGVIYQADQDLFGLNELYLTSILGGGDIFKVNGPLDPGGAVVEGAFTITPDDKGTIYLADQDQFGVFELFVTYDYQLVYLPLIIK